MSDKTSIEWTDRTSVEEIDYRSIDGKSRTDQFHCLPCHPGNPRQRVVVTFGAVTRPACRDDVALLGLTTFSDWNDMVDGGSDPLAAVGAHTRGGLFEHELPHILRQGTHSAPSRRANSTVVAALSVPVSVQLVPVYTTQARTDVFQREPFQASATPRLASRSTLPSFSIAWAWSYPDERTSATRNQTVTARRITIKRNARVPLPTCVTPLLGISNSPFIFVQRDSDTLSRDLSRTNCATHPFIISHSCDKVPS